MAELKFEDGLLTGQFAGHPELAKSFLAERNRQSKAVRLYKRGLDISLTLLFMPLWLSIIAILGLLARLDGGPGFFAHERIGRDGRKFKCWKIRTMVPDAADRLARHLNTNPTARLEWQENHKLNDDPRITRLGSFLRRTSLDEIPQLLNVLRGDMSLVGPRPVVQDELEKYGVYRSGYLAMTPGITGLWQISGRNDVSYAARVMMDMEYLAKSSLVLDLKILIKTLHAVLARTGK